MRLWFQHRINAKSKRWWCPEDSKYATTHPTYPHDIIWPITEAAPLFKVWLIFSITPSLNWCLFCSFRLQLGRNMKREKKWIHKSWGKNQSLNKCMTLMFTNFTLHDNTIFSNYVDIIIMLIRVWYDSKTIQILIIIFIL